MARTQKRIDPVVFAAYALKEVKSLVDYNRVVSANTSATITEAWQTLSSEEQQRITDICKDSPPPNLEAIASEIVGCHTLIELQSVKSQYGEDLTRSAWKLISMDERRRLKLLCESGQKIEETSIPTTYPENVAKVDAWLQKEGLAENKQPQQKTRSLFSISDDLEKLNELLDDCSDDTQQQQLINDWLEQLGEERNIKLDNYSALIVECTSRAAARKVEAQRLMELAASDENRAKLLKDRLKWFFQTHNLATVETARYKLSLAKNGGKQPLVLKDGISPIDLPEQFQRVSVDPDTARIRDALERGEVLEWATLGERGTSMRIK